MNNDWNCKAWDMVLRVIWLCIFAGLVIGGLRLMAWADIGRYGDQPVEKTIWP